MKEGGLPLLPPLSDDVRSLLSHITTVQVAYFEKGLGAVSLLESSLHVQPNHLLHFRRYVPNHLFLVSLPSSILLDLLRQPYQRTRTQRRSRRLALDGSAPRAGLSVSDQKYVKGVFEVRRDADVEVFVRRLSKHHIPERERESVLEPFGDKVTEVEAANRLAL